MRNLVSKASRVPSIVRLALLIVPVVLSAAPVAAQSEPYFSAVSELNCSLMLEQNSDLARLVDAYASDADLVFTRAIPGRLSEYQTLREELDDLTLVPVPFQGDDLDPVAEPERPRLMPTTRTNRVYVPGWERPLNVVLAGGSIIGLTVYGAILDAETRDKNPDASANATLMGAGLGLLLGVPFLLNGTYETEAVEIPANERANERAMRDYRQQLGDVRSLNARRARQRDEQARVREQNERTELRREELQARIERFGAESQEIVRDRIDRLDDASLRCLDRLVYAGAVARYDASMRDGRVTLAVTPLARSGEVMRSTTPEQEFLFSVSRLQLFGDGVATVAIGSPPLTSVRPFDQNEFPILPVTALVVVDSSGSMSSSDPRGLRREGLARFFDQAPASARIGVMEFGGAGGRLLAPITSDMDALKEAVEGVRADGGTPLFAAGLDAVRVLRAEEGSARRVLVMLSDGQNDTNASATADDLVDAARRASIPIHAIALGNDDFSEFEGVALASGGTFTPAPDAEAVVSTLEKLGNILNAAYALDVPVPADQMESLRGASEFVEIDGVVSVEHEGVKADDDTEGRVPVMIAE